MKESRPIPICDLYPEMGEEQLERAARNLQRYAEIIWRIHERLKIESRLRAAPESEPKPDLTDPGTSSNIPDERSIPSNH